MSDLVTDAENKLDSLLAAEGDQPPAADDDGQQPPAGGDNTPPTGEEDQPNGDGEDPDENDDDQPNDDDSQEDQPPQGDEEDPGEGEEQEDDAGKPKGDEAPKELSDDEFLAELERRGLRVEKKDDKQEQPQPPKFERPEEVPQQIWAGMKPVQQYIYNELPYITVKGKDGEGNEVELNVKTYEQLPDDFEYASKKEQLRVSDAMNQQSKRAEDMYAKIQQNSQQSQQQQQEQVERQAILGGVDQLQKDGIVPRITAKPGTPEFDKDPGVIRANQILEYRQKLINAGEQVSVVSAGKMFKADNPDLYKAKPAAAKGDAERKAKSKNISGGGRGTQQQAKKGDDARRKYPIGMSASDIADIAGADLE